MCHGDGLAGVSSPHALRPASARISAHNEGSQIPSRESRLSHSRLVFNAVDGLAREPCRLRNGADCRLLRQHCLNPLKLCLAAAARRLIGAWLVSVRYTFHEPAFCWFDKYLLTIQNEPTILKPPKSNQRVSNVRSRLSSRLDRRARRQPR